jgi:2-polyprenyl-6-methoxyphenol hydroxylase-like FAD-dependent oxidoreductase
MGEQNRKHALVIGGSMGGLVAARVLSDHFEQVTLIDRDTFPECGRHRRGVPQSVHTHGLLASGRRVLEHLFPGISDELIERGVPAGDILADSRWFFEGACLSRCVSGLNGLLLSRPLLEGTVRKRLFTISNVKRIENRVVEGLTATSDNRRVTGVCVQASDDKQRGAETIPADLVVDSTGRGSHSPAWLESIGFAKPEEEKVEVAIAYTTRLFRRRGDHLNGDSAVVIPPTPEGKRGGVMLAQEGDRWTVTLVGYLGRVAPSELPGFIEFAKTLPAPYIHEVVTDAEPIGDAYTARFPASIRRRYDKLKAFPAGFLVFGDAICSFNPIYGQGMSAAAQQSEALQQSLTPGDDNLARRFFKRASKVVDIPWSIAVGSDLRIPETIGPRNAGVNFVNWYIAKLHKAAHRDPEASVAFLKVANLLAPPPSIMHPRIAMRVLLANLRG